MSGSSSQQRIILTLAISMAVVCLGAEPPPTSCAGTSKGVEVLPSRDEVSLLQQKADVRRHQADGTSEAKAATTRGQCESQKCNNGDRRRRGNCRALAQSADNPAGIQLIRGNLAFDVGKPALVDLAGGAFQDTRSEGVVGPYVRGKGPWSTDEAAWQADGGEPDRDLWGNHWNQVRTPEGEHPVWHKCYEMYKLEGEDSTSIVCERFSDEQRHQTIGSWVPTRKEFCDNCHCTPRRPAGVTQASHRAGAEEDFQAANRPHYLTGDRTTSVVVDNGDQDYDDENQDGAGGLVQDVAGGLEQ